MPQAVLIRCPTCRQTSRLRGPADVGKRVRCPHCRRSYEAVPATLQPIGDDDAIAESGSESSKVSATADGGLDDARRSFEDDIAAFESSPLTTRPSVVDDEDRPHRNPASLAVQRVEDPFDEPENDHRARAGARVASEASPAPAPRPSRPKTRKPSPAQATDELPTLPAMVDRPLKKPVQQSSAAAKPRRMHKSKDGFWSISRVALACGLLVAVFGWVLATTFYANMTNNWRTAGIEEMLEMAPGPVRFRGRFYAASGHSLTDFVVNAFRQIPNAFVIAKWSIQTVPWLLIGTCFFEGLVFYFWLTSRKLERKWAEIDERL